MCGSPGIHVVLGPPSDSLVDDVFALNRSSTLFVCVGPQIYHFFICWEGCSTQRTQEVFEPISEQPATPAIVITSRTLGAVAPPIAEESGTTVAISA